MKKSLFIIPISLIVHISIINVWLYIYTPETYLNIYSCIYYNIAWLLTTYGLNFYPTARRDGFLTNIKNFITLFTIYGLAYFSSFIFFGAHYYKTTYLILVYIQICTLLTIFRVIFYWGRNLYRKRRNKNTKVVVIGKDKNLQKLKRIFDNPEYGYSYVGYFDNSKTNNQNCLGDIKSSFHYIFENNIEEVYCMASKLTKVEIQDLIKIADNSLKRIKIIPDHKELFSNTMSIELYGAVPILNLRTSPLDLNYSNLIKRIFDIAFSSIAILFILSWLTPIVYILMKIDSKGPLFFKQKRHGVNRQIFWCYKFRSMTKSETSDTQMASKNDVRVTRLGKILRKTSIDELPQFFNVLMGNMSVVGPRPHMVVHTQEYESSIDKYLVRHFIKPGITGLAQIQGCRGEIIEKADIINRVRYDIFYMEKWSLGLDAKIIFMTVYNAIKGEARAY